MPSPTQSAPTETTVDVGSLKNAASGNDFIETSTDTDHSALTINVEGRVPVTTHESKPHDSTVGECSLKPSGRGRNSNCNIIYQASMTTSISASDRKVKVSPVRKDERELSDGIDFASRVSDEKVRALFKVIKYEKKCKIELGYFSAIPNSNNHAQQPAIIADPRCTNHDNAEALTLYQQNGVLAEARRCVLMRSQDGFNDETRMECLPGCLTKPYPDLFQTLENCGNASNILSATGCELRHDRRRICNCGNNNQLISYSYFQPIGQSYPRKVQTSVVVNYVYPLPLQPWNTARVHSYKTSLILPRSLSMTTTMVKTPDRLKQPEQQICLERNFSLPCANQQSKFRPNSRNIGRMRRYNEQTNSYGSWQDIYASNLSNEVTLNLFRGGKLRFYPNLLSFERQKSLSAAMHKCKLFRQYSFSKVYHEPRSHVLLSSRIRSNGTHSSHNREDDERQRLNSHRNSYHPPTDDRETHGSEQPGYTYHGIKMKALPMDLVPEVASYAEELAKHYKLPQNQWNIGVDLIAYKDGEDSIGWHADDTQGILHKDPFKCVIL